MTAASLEGSRLKVKRAEHHILDLKEGIEAFLQSDPYEIVIKDNPEADRREHRVIRADSPAVDLSLFVGDAVHSLRSALDHLVWQLVIANGGEPNDLKTEFPVWRSESHFKSGRPGNAKGISKDALDVLYALKPYKGGNDALWRLHRLDIIDKHRLLLTVAAAAMTVVFDMGPRMRQAHIEAFGNQGDGWPPESIPVEIVAAEPEIMVPDALVFGAPLGDKESDNTKIGVAVTLHEPEIVGTESVLVTLGQLVSFVNEVIDLFAPFIES